MPRSVLIFATVLMLLYVGAAAIAMSDAPAATPLQKQQPQTCDVISTEDQLAYPVDRSEFMLVNPFGRPNQRFDGRLHAGDDYIRIEGESLGAPVYAFAPGRVTYSNPTGWGRDRGVVIVEHVFSDGVRVYSLYGHIEESETIQFPAAGSCVQQGDVVGVIADPRPAPHLHFEIRTFDPLAPGPGYWPVDPGLAGWLNPRQFIDNRRAWMHPAYEWHIVTSNPDGVFPPPVVMESGLLAYVDGNFLRYLTLNGQVAQQFRLADSVSAVGLLALPDTQLLATDDGRVLVFAIADGLLEVWETEHDTLTAGPLQVGQNLVLMNDMGVYFYNGLRQPLETIELDAGIRKSVATTTHLALYMSDHRLQVFDTRGRLVDEWELRPNSDVIAGAGEGLIIRDQGDIWLWQDSERDLLLEGVTVNRTDAQMIVDGDHLILWGLGSPTRLTALGLDGVVRWQTDVLGIDTTLLTRAVLYSSSSCTLTLVSPRGKVLLFDSRSGRLAQQLKLWGENRSRLWVETDTLQARVLRMQVADQVIAFDLEQLSGIAPLYCQ